LPWSRYSNGTRREPNPLQQAHMLVLSDKQFRERLDFVAFAPTGELYASSYDGLFRWPDPTAQDRERITAAAPVVRPQFSPCGRYFATSKDKLSVYDCERDTRTVPRLPENVWNTAPAFADDLLLMVQFTRHSAKARVAARALKPDNWNDDVWAVEADRGVSVLVGCVADDRLLHATSWWEPSLIRSVHRYTQRDVRTGAIVDESDGPDFGYTFAVSADGTMVANVLNNRVTVVAAENCAEPLAELKNDGRKHFTGIAFHPSGRYLAATSNDETVKLFDTNTWEQAHTFTWKVGRMRSIAFSPDGALAAAGSDKGQIVVWDVDV
jgi:WD40 repeat protein